MSAVDALNAAFAADPNAIYALLCNRVPCNTALADDPHVVCEATPPLGGDKETYHVGALGLINAALTASGLPRVAAKYSDATDEYGRATLLGFVEYPLTEQQHIEKLLHPTLVSYGVGTPIARDTWSAMAEAAHGVKGSHKLWIPGMDDELPPPSQPQTEVLYGWEHWESIGVVIDTTGLREEVPPVQPDAPTWLFGPPEAWPGPWSKISVVGRQVGDRARREAEPNPRDDA